MKLILVVVLVLFFLVLTEVSATTTNPLLATIDDFPDHKCVHDEKVIPMIKKELEKNPIRHAYRVTPANENNDQQQRYAIQTAVGPLRIVVRSPDLDDDTKFCSSSSGTVSDMSGGSIACSTDSILTAEKKNLFLNTIIPAAISKLQTALSVTQEPGNLIVSQGSCGGSWTIPAEDSTTGVPNADYVLYVAGSPTENQVIGWAGACSLTDPVTNRNLVGRCNMNPKFMLWNENDPYLKSKVAMTILHEIIHALGFGASQFLSSTIDVQRRGQTVKCVDTPTVREKYREFTGCSTSDGPEVESQGGGGTANSHFERRNLRDEIMAGITGLYNKLSSMTLATFVDSDQGYIVNFSVSEDSSMNWGQNTGCSFLTEKCGATSSFSSVDGTDAYWCQTIAGSGCSQNRKQIAQCSLTTHTSPISPSYFQYFTNPNEGGSLNDLMDVCPVMNGFSNRICDSNLHTVSQSEEILGFTFGSEEGRFGGRCLHSTGVIQTGFTPVPGEEYRCLLVRCPDSGARVEIKIRNSDWISCNLDGSETTVDVTAPYSGTVTCPAASVICTPDIYFTPPDTTSTTILTTTSTIATSTSSSSSSSSATSSSPPGTTTSTSNDAMTTSTTETPVSTTSSSTTLLTSTTSTTNSNSSETSTTEIPSSTTATPTTETTTSQQVSTTTVPPSTSAPPTTTTNSNNNNWITKKFAIVINFPLLSTNYNHPEIIAALQIDSASTFSVNKIDIMISSTQVQTNPNNEVSIIVSVTSDSSRATEIANAFSNNVQFDSNLLWLNETKKVLMNTFGASDTSGMSLVSAAAQDGNTPSPSDNSYTQRAKAFCSENPGGCAGVVIGTIVAVVLIIAICVKAVVSFKNEKKVGLDEYLKVMNQSAEGSSTHQQFHHQKSFNQFDPWSDNNPQQGTTPTEMLNIRTPQQQQQPQYNNNSHLDHRVWDL